MSSTLTESSTLNIYLEYIIDYQINTRILDYNVR